MAHPQHGNVDGRVLSPQFLQLAEAEHDLLTRFAAGYGAVASRRNWCSGCVDVSSLSGRSGGQTMHTRRANPKPASSRRTARSVTWKGSG